MQERRIDALGTTPYLRDGVLSDRNNRALKLPLLAAPVILALLALPPLLLFLAFLLLVRPLEAAGKELVRPPYHWGSSRVEPERVVAGGDPVPVTITYRVGPGGMARGGSVRLCPCKVLRFGPARWRINLQWANGWGSIQRRHPGRLNYLDVSTGRSDVELDVSLVEKAERRNRLAWLKRKFLQKAGRELSSFDPKDAFIENQKVTVELTGGRLDEGDEVRFKLGPGAGLEVPYYSIKTDFAIEVDPGGDGDFLLEADVPALTATGGRPASLEVIAPTRAAPGTRVRILVRFLDQRGVLAPDFSGRILLSTSGALSAPPYVLVPGGGEGVAWFEAHVTGRGVARVHARSGDGRLEGESNPIICGEGPYRLLWGDLHTHSIISDGTQEPGCLYHRARELEGWDFTAVTDHDFWSLAEEHPRSDEEFDMMVRSAESYYAPGEFVTFPAYEWTDHRLGHRNVYFGPGETPVFLPHTDPRYGTPALLLESLGGRNALVIGHHPAWRTHRGEMHFDYGPAGNPLQRLVEVYSRHGNSEYFGCPRPLSHVALMEGMRGKLVRAVLGDESAGPRSGSYVRDALARGHRLGLIGGGDEHLVGSDPRKGAGFMHSGGITGLFAATARREHAWDALLCRRVCATTGARIFMEMRVNGRPQGSELKSDGPVRITGHVVGTTDLELVELVKFDGEGYTAPWQGGGGPEEVVHFTDRGFKSDSFYYLRVEQADGHLGWAGPTWVDLAR